MRRALARYGGVLMAPRATVGALDPDEGERDGVWMSLLFVGAVGIAGLVAGAADLAATRNLNGLLMLLSALGRSLIVPIVALVGVETILGAARAHRRGLCLVPMVVVAALLREIPLSGVLSWAFAPDVIAIVAAVGMALWIRPAIPPREVDGK